MNPAVVSEKLAVGEVPRLEHVALLAECGFMSIITVQPDGEVTRLPASSAVGIEAARRGLMHAYAPISSRTPSPEELATFETAVRELPAPIYACCYSGARSAAAAAFMLTSDKDVDVIIEEFKCAGHDISTLKPWLEDERRQRTQRANLSKAE